MRLLGLVTATGILRPTYARILTISPCTSFAPGPCVIDRDPEQVRLELAQLIKEQIDTTETRTLTDAEHFSTFTELGSVRTVWFWFRSEGLSFPLRAPMKSDGSRVRSFCRDSECSRLMRLRMNLFRQDYRPGTRRVLSQRRRRANRSGRGGGFSPSCDARGCTFIPIGGRRPM